MNDDSIKILQAIKAAKLVNNIDLDWQVSFYTDLMRIIRNDNEITPVTRLAFERFYVMNQAGLSKVWRDRYFEIANKYLKRTKARNNLQFAELIKEIGVCNKSVQSSFTSKLLHTLNEDAPIYDKFVRAFLEVGDVKGKTVEDRMKSAAENYEKIKNFYTDEENTKLRESMIEALIAECPEAENISDTKKIDFVLWMLGKQGLHVGDLKSAKS